VAGHTLRDAEEAFDASGATGAVVLRDGEIVAAWGDVETPFNVRSVRKSILSLLFGSVTRERPVDLHATLAELGIDDTGGLTAEERRATLGDLLTTRSGVYHEAAAETEEMKLQRPARGSHRPGTFWYYNNWDFNALGTIFTRLTGEDVFDAFARRLAEPLHLQSFVRGDHRLLCEPASEHGAYVFHLSAGDLARIGRLCLDGGAPLVDAAWLAESTRSHSPTDHAGLGYGYMWWIPRHSRVLGRGAYLALGAGGQGIAVVPAHRLMMSHVVDVAPGAERLKSDDFIRLLRMVVRALS
jgi:CubicO group peptidase (beta-lactamase class C family)